MMRPHLQQRFDQLLGFIKEPSYHLSAGTNVAVARELLETLLHSELILPDEYRAYHAQIRAAQLVSGATELKRVDDSMKLSVNTWDGSRTDETVSVRGQQVEVSEFLRKPV